MTVYPPAQRHRGNPSERISALFREPTPELQKATAKSGIWRLPPPGLAESRLKLLQAG